ncbi:MAG: thioredoxin family protein [Planctomycetota bacterium]|jgi:thiol-disulfide isomerase/thioredoxin
MVRNRYIAVFLTALVAASLLSAQVRPEQQNPVNGSDKGLKWVNSYQAGMNAARARKRPVLIKFEAEWCEWCKKLDSEVFAQPQIIKALENYVCIKVDVDKQRNAALAYKIRSLPRIIIVNIHNEIVGDWLGFRDAPAFSKSLEEVWGYTLTEAGTMPAPTVRAEPSASARRREVASFDPGDGDSLIKLLGHKDPAFRAGAIEVLVKGGAKSVPVVVGALESKYLGTRIAAWKVVRKLKGSKLVFDPWAPGPERALAARKLRTQLGLPLRQAQAISESVVERITPPEQSGLR